MNYKDCIKKEMEEIANDKNSIFIGYNIIRGSRAYGTLSGVPIEKCLETPVAENLMCGIAAGMSLEGFKPVLFFERHDFILNGLDCLVNHLSKIEKMSAGEFLPKLIIRAVIGSRKPLDPGLQHIQDFSEVFKQLLSFPVYILNNEQDIIQCYGEAKKFEKPIMLIEKKDIYEQEF